MPFFVDSSDQTRYNERIMKNLPIVECEKLLADSANRKKADRIVSSFGFRADLKGSDRLADCVILYGSNAASGFCEIYSIVGKLRDTGAKAVLRTINYAMSRAYGMTDKLSELVGANIPRNEIHNSLVIAHLGKIYRYDSPRETDGGDD